MIYRIWAVAINTYREAIRQKILYTLVFFAGALILFSFFLGQLSLGADVKVIKDLGLASIMFFGVLISIFMGVGLISKEVEKKTIYTLLSKPLNRTEFIFGKFFGLSMTVTLEAIFMVTLLFGLLSFYRDSLDFRLLKAVFMICCELNILIAVALLFSSYSSQFMSMLFCLGFLVLGHLTDDFQAAVSPRAFKMVASGGGDAIVGQVILSFAWVLKQMSLDHFAINSQVVYGVQVSFQWLLQGALYATCWVVILLMIAASLFERKDLK